MIGSQNEGGGGGGGEEESPLAFLSSQGRSPDGVHLLPPLDQPEVGRRALRALQTLLEARKSSNDPSPLHEARLLETLKSTTFGQSVAHTILQRFIKEVELEEIDSGDVIELRGTSDCLYVLLEGSFEIIRGPHLRVRPFQLYVESARNLVGDGDDILDPYVVVRLGKQEERTQIEMDAGESPVWNWSASFTYNGEPEIELTVYEYDQFSKDTILGVATLSYIDFTGPAGFDGEIMLSPPDRSLMADAALGIREGYALEDANSEVGDVLTVIGEDDEEDDEESEGDSDDDESAKSETTNVKRNDHGTKRGVDCGALRIRLMWTADFSHTLGRSQALTSQLRQLQLQQLQQHQQQSEDPHEGVEDEEGPTRVDSPQSFITSLRSHRNLGMSNKLGGTGKLTIASGPYSPAASLTKARGMMGSIASEKSMGALSSHRVAGAGREVVTEGGCFGIEDGGGAFRALEQCQCLVVSRAVMAEANRSHQESVRTEREVFLARHLPGLQKLDRRAFRNLASSFEEIPFPRRHKLCQTGDMQDENGARWLYLIKEGQCIMQSTSEPSASSSCSPDPPKIHQSSLRGTTKETPLGILGPGSIVGAAAAVFGVPEPFTVVADEKVVALGIDVDAKPVSSWPKEVVHALKHSLSARTDWHTKRSCQLSAVLEVSDHLTDKPTDVMPPAWSREASPRLRNKNLSPWQADALRDRFDAEGWSGGPPVVTVSTSSAALVANERSRSNSPRSSPAPSPRAPAPSLHGGSSTAASHASQRLEVPGHVFPANAPHQFAGRGMPDSEGSVVSARTASHGSANTEGGRASTCSATSSSTSGIASSTSETFLAGRGSYALNRGLGRCQTPWGLWTPSGLLPPATRGSPNSRLHRRMPPRDKGSKSSSHSAPDLSSTRSEDEDHHHKIDLKCRRDWQQLSALTAGPCLRKMHRQQVRASCLASAATTMTQAERTSWTNDRYLQTHPRPMSGRSQGLQQSMRSSDCTTAAAAGGGGGGGSVAIATRRFSSLSLRGAGPSSEGSFLKGRTATTTITLSGGLGLLQSQALAQAQLRMQAQTKGPTNHHWPAQGAAPSQDRVCVSEHEAPTLL